MRELTLDPEGQPECLNAGMAGRGYPDQRGEHACAPEIRPLDPYWDHFEIMLGSLLKSFQKLPKHSRNYRHLPETTDTFQKLQTHSRNNRNIPETTKTFQKLPAHSRNYRNIPETIETFQKLPTQIICKTSCPYVFHFFFEIHKDLRIHQTSKCPC